MYRKQADKLFVRDVKKRLAAMEAPDWMQAAILCASAHPDWFRHRPVWEVDELLRAEGVDLVTAEPKFRFVGNVRSADGCEE